MSSTSDEGGSYTKKYKGIRRRKWGKWVSEIRVPGTQERLWLGSYSTPEAAAIAHDVAFYCLRGISSPEKLNFPLMLPASARTGLSPRSVQNAASDAGMAMDAQLSSENSTNKRENGKEEDLNLLQNEYCETSWDGCGKSNEGEDLNISVDDYL
ncbi:ethylene-responsive transcription factor ERF020-like [Olea europaea var. sylvestris]|uniref:ethylene-responsive transcription factor ERF020-like n=1 Tax=Olea europaea var. sylvestris TaxID=158386 RepID=UPI000C1D7468|nr:ethylene-responsive transcription factor ERF020-like [Olea europaea var. sylvestris]